METSAGAVPDPLAGYSEPDELERRFYLNGLAGEPRLIARTSTDAYSAGDHVEWFRPPKKAFRTLGSHEIVAKWNPSLRDALVRTLDQAGLDWHYFVPIRLFELDERSWASQPIGDAVLFVGVEGDTNVDVPDRNLDLRYNRGSTGGPLIMDAPDNERITCTWQAGLRTALRCRQVLRNSGVQNIEVVLATSAVRPLSSLSSPLSSVAANKLLAKIQFEPSRRMDFQLPARHKTVFNRYVQCADINGTVMPLLPFPGCEIEQPSKHPEQHHGQGQEQEQDRTEALTQSKAARGTLGLYVGLRTPAGTQVKKTTQPDAYVRDKAREGAFALTCRHVAVAGRANGDQDIVEGSPSGRPITPLHVLTGGAVYSSRCCEDLGRLVKKNLSEEAKTAMDEIKENPTSDVVAERFSFANKARGYLDNLIKDVEATISTPFSEAERCLGLVAYSPRHAISAPGHYQDWALVRLFKHDEGGDMSHGSQGPGIHNKIYLAGTAIEKATSAELHIQSGGQGRDRRELTVNMAPIIKEMGDRMDRDGFLQLRADKIPRAPRFGWQEYRQGQGQGGGGDKDDKTKKRTVAKRGFKTGLTFGFVNEIEAVLRRPTETPSQASDSGFFVSYNMVVVNIYTAEQFSDHGDSGSVVFDTSGQVVGLVDAGLDRVSAFERYYKKYEPDSSASSVRETTEAFAAASASTSAREAAMPLPPQRPVPVGFPDYDYGSGPGPARVSDLTFVTPIQWVLEGVEKLTGLEAYVI